MNISQVLKATPAPAKGFIVDVVQYPKFHALRFYADNFEEYSEPQKALILEWLNEKLILINQFTPCRLEKEARS